MAEAGRCHPALLGMAGFLSFDARACLSLAIRVAWIAMTRALFLALILPALMVSCGHLKGRKAKKEKPEENPSGQATLVGMVEMVNPEQDYVVIRTEAPVGYPAGTELIALGAGGNRSRVVLTPERKGLHLTADIKSGQPQVSNLVLYYPPAPTEPTPAPTPTPTSPATPPAPTPAMSPDASAAAPVPGLPPLPTQPGLPAAPSPTMPPQPLPSAPPVGGSVPDLSGLEPVVR